MDVLVECVSKEVRAGSEFGKHGPDGSVDDMMLRSSCFLSNEVAVFDSLSEQLLSFESDECFVSICGYDVSWLTSTISIRPKMYRDPPEGFVFSKDWVCDMIRIDNANSPTGRMIVKRRLVCDGSATPKAKRVRDDESVRSSHRRNVSFQVC